MTTLISGGASGVGESVAEKLVGQGKKVIIVDILRPKNELLASPLVSWIDFDLREVNYDAITNFLTSNRCVLEGLCIYAGFTGFSSLENLSYQDYRNIFDLNVWSALKLSSIFTNFCCPKGSSIVLIGSPHQDLGEINRLLYSVSKATLKTLNSHISIHYADRKVRCNLVVLGWTDTPGERALRTNVGQDLDKVGEQSEIKNVRIFESDEFDANLIFLLSKASSPVSGSVIDLTGGLRI